MRINPCERLPLRDVVGRFIPHNEEVEIVCFDHTDYSIRETGERVYKTLWKGMEWQISYSQEDMGYFEAHPDVLPCPIELQYANVVGFCDFNSHPWPVYYIEVNPAELVFDEEDEVITSEGNKLYFDSETGWSCIDTSQYTMTEKQREGLDEALDCINDKYCNYLNENSTYEC